MPQFKANQTSGGSYFKQQQQKINKKSERENCGFASVAEQVVQSQNRLTIVCVFVFMAENPPANFDRRAQRKRESEKEQKSLSKNQ